MKADRPRPAVSTIAAMAAAALAGAGGTCRAATPLAWILHEDGPAAGPVYLLGWGLTALCIGVCVVIAVLLAFAIARTRPPPGPREERAANVLVIAGTAVSAVLLLGALVAMLVVLVAVAEPPHRPALTVTVTAYDWWWKVTYPANSPTDSSTHSGETFDTANEIHIPTGQPVLIELKSADVVHAFWVPALAGKTQTIPGQTNRQWLQADHPGVWRGQCTQYCGAQHAHMALEVVAQTPDAFARWLDAQRQPAAAPATDAAMRGERVFDAHCAACHAIRGTDAAGAQAPDLTHLQSRRLLAAGTLANTPANLLDWIAHAQQIKPESLMPSIALSRTDANDLASWLATLQ